MPLTGASLARAFRGFTLIEVMIVTAIIAILTVIALPSYESHIRRQKVRLAQSDLVGLSLAMENRFQQQITYPPATSGAAAIRALLPAWTPASQASDFSFAISESTADAYTLVASGLSGKLAGCTVTLQSDNTRSLAGCGQDGGWY
jgi:type IV pilus assembly protein PilE